MSLPGQPLLIVGLAAWAGALGGWAVVALGLPWWVWAVVGATVALMGVFPLVAVRRVTAVASAGLLVALGLLAGGASAGAHLAATRPADVRALAAQGAVVQAEGVVQSFSVVTRPDGRPYARAVVELRSLGPPERREAVRGSAVLIGRPAAFGDLARGGRLAVEGTLLPIQPWREPGLAIAVKDVAGRAPPSGFPSFVAAARQDMWGSLARIDPDAASLVAGLAVGDDSRQTEELAQAMRSAGLSHLTAVSGGNIAIVAGLIIAGAALAGAGLKVRIAAAVAAVIGYAAFVGPEPSVLRAAVMGVVAVIGLMRTTRTGGFPLLGAAVLALILLRPGLAVSWGFALSVSATAGILFLGPRVERLLGDRLPRAPSALVTAVAVTLAAQVATAPLIAAMTGTFSLIALPANLAAAPLVVPITVIGLLLVVVSVAAPSLGVLLAHAVEPFGLLLARIATWAAGVPHGSLTVPTGALGALVVAVSLALLAALCAVGRAPPRPTRVP